MEKTPAELEAERQALAKTEETDLENQPGQVKTSAEIAAEMKEKYKDLSPEEIFAKIAEEFAKKDEIILHKNRAISSLKKPKEETPPAKTEASADDLEKKFNEMLDKRFGSFQQSTAVDQKISALTSDAGEQAKIREAYNNSIVKSGNIEADLKNALAIANLQIIEDYKKNRSEAETQEMLMTRFMGGQPSGGHDDGNPMSDPVKKGAYENMIKAGVSAEAAMKAIKNM